MIKPNIESMREHVAGFKTKGRLFTTILRDGSSALVQPVAGGMLPVIVIQDDPDGLYAHAIQNAPALLESALLYIEEMETALQKMATTTEQLVGKDTP